MEVSPREYQHLLRNITYGLTSTQLKKLARVVSLYKERESGIIQFLENEFTRLPLPYELQNFNTVAAARQWLLSDR